MGDETQIAVVEWLQWALNHWSWWLEPAKWLLYFECWQWQLYKQEGVFRQAVPVMLYTSKCTNSDITTRYSRAWLTRLGHVIFAMTKSCLFSQSSCMSLVNERSRLTICMLGNFFMIFVDCWFFFIRTSFRNIGRLLTVVDPDQARYPVEPGLGPNCLKRSAVDDKIIH